MQNINDLLKAMKATKVTTQNTYHNKKMSKLGEEEYVTDFYGNF